MIDAKKAAEAIVEWLGEPTPIDKKLAPLLSPIIDQALAEERKAAEEMKAALELWTNTRESNKKLYGVDHIARNAVERIDDAIRSAIESWKRARGQA